MADITDAVGMNVSYVYQYTNIMLAKEGETLKDIVYKAKVELEFKLLCKAKEEFTRLGDMDDLGEKRTVVSKI